MSTRFFWFFLNDDNRLYISANLSQLQEVIRVSQSCILDAQAWMDYSKLPMNPNKTELILITSKHNQNSVYLCFLSIWMELRFISLQLSAAWASPSTRISLFINMSPAPVKSVILNCLEPLLCVTTCHNMPSKHWSLPLPYPESITTTLYTLAVLSNLFTNFRKKKKSGGRGGVRYEARLSSF